MFHSSYLTGVKLWGVIALQTVWWEMGRWFKLRSKRCCGTFVSALWRLCEARCHGRLLSQRLHVKLSLHVCSQQPLCFPGQQETFLSTSLQLHWCGGQSFVFCFCFNSRRLIFFCLGLGGKYQSLHHCAIRASNSLIFLNSLPLSVTSIRAVINALWIRHN